MRRSVLPLLLVATAAGCALPGQAAVRVFPVGGFDRVSNSTPFDVRVHTGTAPSARAEGPQEALDRLDVTVRDGALVIATHGGGWFSGWRAHGGRMVIDVGVPMIRAALLSGPGDLSVDHVRGPAFTATLNGPGDLTVGALETERLGLTLNGPGDVTLAGHAAQATMVLHGPGDIHAANLVVRDADIQLSGPGDIVATVTGTAQGTLTGPGDITIKGGARCAISKHGPGDVICR